jgi:hypothetical protein
MSLTFAHPLCLHSRRHVIQRQNLVQLIHGVRVPVAIDTFNKRVAIAKIVGLSWRLLGVVLHIRMFDACGSNISGINHFSYHLFLSCSGLKPCGAVKEKAGTKKRFH